jgi:hypothetical protein
MSADTLTSIATITALLVVIVELLKRIENMLGGSPEMRAIRSQLDEFNKHHLVVLRTISARVSVIASKLGV